MPTPLDQSWQTAATVLNGGGVAVVPTDTLYGVVASALQPAAIDRLYQLRERDLHKPFIILIHDAAALGRFGVAPDARTQTLLDGVWPGPVSVVLAATDPALAYLHRGSGGLSFRVPAAPALREFLAATGPLAAPSANLQGAEPARTIAEAQVYFGNAAGAYVDAGRLDGAPSALVDARTLPPRVLRPGPGFS